MNPQGKFKVEVSPALRAAVPFLRLVVCEAQLSVPVKDLSSALARAELDGRLSAIKAHLRAQGTSRETISQHPAISWGRKAYRALGKDPTKYRLSSEKLLRRFLGDEGFPYYTASGGPIVDFSNCLSLRFACPVGTVDLEKLRGPSVTVDHGRVGETYTSLSGMTLNLEGLIISRDASGPFGSTTADSNRSGIEGETQHLQVIVFIFDPQTQLDQVADYCEDHLRAIDPMAAITLDLCQ